MIKIDIDYSKASQSEIDALNAVPGFEAAISHIQTHNRKLNVELTVREPGDQLVEVKALLMEFMRDFKMEVGHVLPARPLMHNFFPKLNPKQRELVDKLLETLVDEGVFTLEQGNYRLTQVGFDALY